MVRHKPVVPKDVEDKKAAEARIDAEYKATIEKRMTELPTYDEAIRKALVIQPHEVELVRIEPAAMKPK